MRSALLALTALLVVAAPANAQLSIRLTAPAPPPGKTVHVAGSFNDWNPDAADYVLAAQPDGTFAITLPERVRGLVTFKFTLGSWDMGELQADGAPAPNRSFKIPASGPAAYFGAVPGWGAGPTLARPHTATASVSVFSEALAIPQLHRTRRVWIYLPPGYAASGRRYPVIYMQDGQNVFDLATSGYGEWGVDEALDALARRGDPGAIVVAVDHGAEHRLDEYNPWPNTVDPRYGGGEGDLYVDFLINSLKPLIDARYRTLRDPAHTAIMGSSMGGLISLYAGIRHPDVFGRVGVFSSATWLARARMLALAAQPRGRAARTQRFYFVCGAGEGNDGQPGMVAQDQAATVQALRAGGLPAVAIRSLSPADGKHQEWFWRREFPKAYQWLLAR